MEGLPWSLFLSTPPIDWILAPFIVAAGYLSACFVVGAVGRGIVAYVRIRRRRATYRQWIRRAREERDTKQHPILLLCNSDEPDGDNNDAPRQNDHEPGPRGMVTPPPTSCLTAVDTARRIAHGTLDVTKNVAFLARRCRTLGREQGLNAITEEFYQEAADRAQQLTKERGVSGEKELPCLFGVPICVKEFIGLRGSYSTAGLACRLRSRDAEDSLIVQVLKEAGAIPLVKGNLTQLMMLPESTNRIWGRSSNPHNASRTPGGSSGGDAALVASGCVPMSVSSDVAGSIRIPASFCGVVGFKPSSMRVSGKGNMSPRLHNKHGTRIVIPAVIGPIARTVEDCALFLEAVLCPALFRGDRNLVAAPFDDNEYRSTRPLRIGYFETDHWFEPCATSKRAVREAVAALREAGHVCVPFDPPTDGWKHYGLVVAVNGAEGNMRSFVEALEDEEIIPEYQVLLRASRLPSWLSWLLRRIVAPRLAHLLSRTKSGGTSVWELWQRTAELLEMRNAWSDAMRINDLDAVVHPAVPLPAFPHGMGSKLNFACSYMFIANLLLWPCGAVPVTKVRPDETQYNPPLHQRDKIARDAALALGESSVGLPLSVCVMTTNYQDETCLRLMKDIERYVAT